MNERLRLKRIYTYTAMFIVTLIGLALYLTILKPMLHQLEDLQQQVTVESDKIKDLGTQLEELRAGAASHNSIELQKSIPVTPSIDQLVLDLTHLEKQSGIIINDIGFNYNNETEKQSGSFSEHLIKMINSKQSEETDNDLQWLEMVHISAISFTIQVTGSYLDLMEFLELSKGLPRTLHVDRIQFQNEFSKASLEENAGEELSGSLTLTAYYTEKFAPFVTEAPEVKVIPKATRDNPLYFKP